jgi:hypothetical protein
MSVAKIFTLEVLARAFVALFCGWTAISLLFFFDHAVVQFSPGGTPPSWLTQAGGLSSVRLVSQLHRSILMFFALNNLVRLSGRKLVYPCFAVSLLFVVKALFDLSQTGKL